MVNSHAWSKARSRPIAVVCLVQDFPFSNHDITFQIYNLSVYLSMVRMFHRAVYHPPQMTNLGNSMMRIETGRST